MRQIQPGVRDRFRMLFRAGAISLLIFIAISCGPFLLQRAFPVSRYMRADDTSQLTDRYSLLLPVASTGIIIRSYETDWWVTLECECDVDAAKSYAKSIGATLSVASGSSKITIPDHTTEASRLEMIEFYDGNGNWLIGSGTWGMGITLLAFDTQENRFFLCKSRI